MQIEPKYLDVKKGNDSIATIITWSNIKQNDKCDWAEAVGIKRSVFASGNFGKLGLASILGSNDRNEVGSLNSHFGLKLNLKNSNEFAEINEASRYIRPNLLNGDDDTNLTISIMVIL